MIPKVLIICSAIAAVHASAIFNAHLINTGISTSSRQQDAYGNYIFGYDIKDGLGATNSRSEVGNAHGNKKGSYTLADIDGRARRVDYVADGHGFRAVVKTNEPGTAASAPAAALVASPYAGPIAPVVNHVVPAATVVGHAAAPLAVAAPVIIGHAAAPLAVAAPVIIGHAAAPLAVAAPVIIGHAAAPLAVAAPVVSAPVAHDGVLGHGAGLRYGTIIGNNLGLGLGVEKALIY